MKVGTAKDPVKGMRFTHARYIDSDGRPEVYRVTAVRSSSGGCRTVWYRADDEGKPGQLWCGLGYFQTAVVKDVL